MTNQVMEDKEVGGSDFHFSHKVEENLDHHQILFHCKGNGQLGNHDLDLQMTNQVMKDNEVGGSDLHFSHKVEEKLDHHQILFHCKGEVVMAVLILVAKVAHMLKVEFFPQYL